MIQNALIIVDVQNDFCSDGALGVPGGEQIIPLINRLMPRFDRVVATQDWHPEGHASFASQYSKSPFGVINLDGIEQVLWPDHAVQGSWGGQFHKDLDLKSIDLFVRKGQNPELDSYSAFFENDKKTETGLHYYLNGLGINDLYFVGLAWDYCVYFSAMDASQLGYNCFLIQEGSRGVDFPEGNVEHTTQKMTNAGVKIISHEQLTV